MYVIDFLSFPEMQTTVPDTRGRGAGTGVIIVTNADFDFTEKPSFKSPPSYITKVQPDVVTVIYTGTGSVLKFPFYGSLLATLFILIFCQMHC